MSPRQRAVTVAAVTAGLLVVGSVVTWAVHHADDEPPTAHSVFTGHRIDASASTAPDSSEVAEPTGRRAAGTASVSGTLMSEDGPVAGVEVALERYDVQGQQTRAAATSTTAQGHFSFAVSPSTGDRFEIVVPEPPAGHELTSSETFSLTKDRRTHRTVALTPTEPTPGSPAPEPTPKPEPTPAPVAQTGAISGQISAAGGERGEVTIEVFDVSDGPTGEPVATIRVPAGESRYRLPDLPAGSYKVLAIADGWIDTWYGAGSPALWGEADIVKVAAGEVVRSISIMLRPASALPETSDPLVGSSSGD